jgi:hypothetical protein
MTVTDDQVAVLRAHLAGDYDEHRRLLAGLDSRGALGGYTALVTAAFVEAVDRRFGPAHRDASWGRGTITRDKVRLALPSW